MSDARATAPTLGMKLRRRRKQAGMTLQEVAAKASLSIGFVSQVERDLSAPSLSSLIGLAGALGARVEEFVRSPDTPGPISRHRQRATYTTGGTTAGNAPAYERVSDDFPGRQLSSVIITLPPRYSAEAISHDGEELMYVIDGHVQCTIDGVTRTLSPGDSVHFPSRLSHSTSNPDDVPAHVLWVGTLQLFANGAPIGEGAETPGGLALEDDPAPKPAHKSTTEASRTSGSGD